MFCRIVTDVMHAPVFYAFDAERGGGHMIIEGVYILDLITWPVDCEPWKIF